MDSTSDFDAKNIFEDDENEENDPASNYSTEALIEQYVKQLTDGCGSATCTNKNCASSGNIYLKLSKGEARFQAKELVKFGGELCCTGLTSSRSTANPNMTSSANCKELGKKKGPYITEQIITQVIENCKTKNNYDQLTDILFIVFRSVNKLCNSFLKQYTPHLADVFTFDELALMSKEKIRELEGEFEKDEEEYEEVNKSLKSDLLDIDVPSLRRSYEKLFSLDKSIFEYVLVKTLCTLTRKLQVQLYEFSIASEPIESLLKYVNVFFIIFELPVFFVGGFFTDVILPQLCRAIALLPLPIQARMCRVWARYSKDGIKDMLTMIQELITMRVITGQDNNLYEDMHITSATKFLRILLYVNALAGESVEPYLIDDEDYVDYEDVQISASKWNTAPIIDYGRKDELAKELKIDLLRCVNPAILFSQFYNEAISEVVQMDKDLNRFVNAEMNTTCGTMMEDNFSFTSYPFILSTCTKSRSLYYDNRIKMYGQRYLSILNTRSSDGIKHDPPYLTLEVRRDHLISDTLLELELYGLQTMKNFKKQLIVKFIGEQAIDEGGVSKEFFQLIIEEIFNPDYGMFKWCTQTETFWFTIDTFESEAQCSMIGLILGLAIYNNVILDIRFPKVFYRKLLGKKGVYQDLEDFDPLLYSSLTLLLDHEKDDVEDVFSLNFQISYTDSFGKLCTYDLIPQGATRQVTKSNKQDFVNLYADFLLNTSIKNQFNAFRRGFQLVTNESLLKRLFRPEEIEILLCGSKEFDLNELSLYTRYEGYTESSPVIKYFWEFLNSVSIDDQRKFLQFTTGSDRIPAGGFRKLNLVIVRNGQDSNRLPTAHTCFNMLLLPEYSTKEKLVDRLKTSIDYSKGFGLL